jgi:hypothetical protein
MPMSERDAQEFVRPLEALPAIEARKRDRRRRRHPIRLAVVIGAIGILGTGSAVAAIEKFSEGSEAKREQGMTKEQRRLKGASEASSQELDREVREHSGGSISPSEVDPRSVRRSARRQLEIEFPDELRFYNAKHRLVHVTKCSWPHPNPDCTDPIEAIKRYPGAGGVETWSNGRPIAGGS